jgi:hypothetical protein
LKDKSHECSSYGIENGIPVMAFAGIEPIESKTAKPRPLTAPFFVGVKTNLLQQGPEYLHFLYGLKRIYYFGTTRARVFAKWKRTVCSTVPKGAKRAKSHRAGSNHGSLRISCNVKLCFTWESTDSATMPKGAERTKSQRAGSNHGSPHYE